MHLKEASWYYTFVPDIYPGYASTSVRRMSRDSVELEIALAAFQSKVEDITSDVKI